MRHFAGLRLSDSIPDETTILNFRHFLEKHGLGKLFFEEKRMFGDAGYVGVQKRKENKHRKGIAWLISARIGKRKTMTVCACWLG